MTAQKEEEASTIKAKHIWFDPNWMIYTSENSKNSNK